MNLTSLTLLVAGPIFAITGYILKKYPPEEINWMFGYRTPASGKNNDTWRVANAYAANIVLAGGIILTILGMVSLALPEMDGPGKYIGQYLLVAFLIILFTATEIHLHKIFDKDGKRRA